MTGSEPTTSQIAIFLVDWCTRNDAENLDHEAGPETCADRLREALEGAFPKVSKATLEAALQVIRKAMLHR